MISFNSPDIFLNEQIFFYLDCSTPFLIDVVFDGTSDAGAGADNTANTDKSKGKVIILHVSILKMCRYIQLHL